MNSNPTSTQTEKVQRVLTSHGNRIQSPTSLQQDFRRIHMKLPNISQIISSNRSPKTHDALTQLLHLSPSRRSPTLPSAVESSPQQPQAHQLAQPPSNTSQSPVLNHFLQVSFESPLKKPYRLKTEESPYVSSIKRGIVLTKSADKSYTSNSVDAKKSLRVSNEQIHIQNPSTKITQKDAGDSHQINSKGSSKKSTLISFSFHPSAAAAVDSSTISSSDASNNIDSANNNPNDITNLSFYSGEQHKKFKKIFIGKTFSKRMPQNREESIEMNKTNMILQATFSNSEFGLSTKTLLETINKQIDHPLLTPLQQQQQQQFQQKYKYLIDDDNNSSKNHRTFENKELIARGLSKIRIKSSTPSMHSLKLDGAPTNRNTVISANSSGIDEYRMYSADSSPLKTRNSSQPAVTQSLVVGSGTAANGFHNKNILKRHHLVRNVREISQFNKTKRSQMFQFVYESPTKQQQPPHKKTQILKNSHINPALNCVEIFNA